MGVDGPREAARQFGVKEQTYCRWRKEYGGPRFDKAARLWVTDEDNQRIEKIAVEQEVDTLTLKEAAEGFP